MASEMDIKRATPVDELRSRLKELEEQATHVGFSVEQSRLHLTQLETLHIGLTEAVAAMKRVLADAVITANKPADNEEQIEYVRESLRNR